MTAKRLIVLATVSVTLVLGAETLEEINAKLTKLGAQQSQKNPLPQLTDAEEGENMLIQ